MTTVIPIEVPKHFTYSLEFYPSNIAPFGYDKWSPVDRKHYEEEQLRVYRQHAKKVFKWSDTLSCMHEDWDTPCGPSVAEFAIMHEYLANKNRQRKQQQNKKRGHVDDIENPNKKLKTESV